MLALTLGPLANVADPDQALESVVCPTVRLVLCNGTRFVDSRRDNRHSSQRLRCRRTRDDPDPVQVLL